MCTILVLLLCIMWECIEGVYGVSLLASPGGMAVGMLG